MNRYIARLDFGAQCGSPSWVTPDLACGLGPDAKARSSNPALAKRLASAAQPSTFPLRPRNWRRDSETNHSFLSPEGTGKSIGVTLSSQSLHRGCCFIETFNFTYLLTVSSRLSISLAIMVHAASSGSEIELSGLVSPEFTRARASFGFAVYWLC